MDTYYTNAPEVQEIARIAFPSYTGKKFKVSTFSGSMRLDSYWDGGSRTYYSIVNMKTKRAKQIPENGSPYSGKPYRISKLPEGFAVVANSIFMGKDSGITVYVNPENITKMLPAPDETPWTEKVVLSATRSLKSSYAGIKDYRLREAIRETGITKDEWDKAKESLIQKGMLNKAGAITDKGRNAIGRTNLSDLKRDKQLQSKDVEPSQPVNENMGSVPEVEIAERIETYWKCPHCKQEIYEKHSYPADSNNVYGREEIHSDCGGKFLRPEMTDDEKNWLNQIKDRFSVVDKKSH